MLSGIITDRVLALIGRSPNGHFITLVTLEGNILSVAYGDPAPMSHETRERSYFYDLLKELRLPSCVVQAMQDRSPFPNLLPDGWQQIDTDDDHEAVVYALENL